MRRWLAAVALTGTTLGASAQWGAAPNWAEPTDAMPAHFKVAPKARVPPILSGDQLSGPAFSKPMQVIVYKMAARVAPVLLLQPCYCRCDRALRHKSLHSCFEGLHGAACATCMREAVYTYQMTKKGMTPDRIRAGLERGEWQSIDLESASL